MQRGPKGKGEDPEVQRGPEIGKGLGPWKETQKTGAPLPERVHDRHPCDVGS